jgi:hypothetical protein
MTEFPAGVELGFVPAKGNGRVDPLGQRAVRAGDTPEAGGLHSSRREFEESVGDQEVDGGVGRVRESAHQVEDPAPTVIETVPGDEADDPVVVVDGDATVAGLHRAGIETAEGEAHLPSPLGGEPRVGDRGGGCTEFVGPGRDPEPGAAGGRHAVADVRSAFPGEAEARQVDDGVLRDGSGPHALIAIGSRVGDRGEGRAKALPPQKVDGESEALRFAAGGGRDVGGHDRPAAPSDEAGAEQSGRAEEFAPFAEVERAHRGPSPDLDGGGHRRRGARDETAGRSLLQHLSGCAEPNGCRFE